VRLHRRTAISRKETNNLLRPAQVVVQLSKKQATAFTTPDWLLSDSGEITGKPEVIPRVADNTGMVFLR
jgi:hypothetical protein